MVVDFNTTVEGSDIGSAASFSSSRDSRPRVVPVNTQNQ